MGKDLAAVFPTASAPHKSNKGWKPLPFSPSQNESFIVTGLFATLFKINLKTI